MKKKKYFIIAAALIVLLAAGTIFISNMNTNDGEIKTDSDVNTDSGSYDVFTDSAENLSEVEVQTESFAIKAVNKGNSEWTIDGQDESDISSAKAYALASTVANLTSSDKYEDIQDKSEYGLENPSVTVNITKKNGSRENLYIGAMSPVSGEYFIQRSGDEAIYTMHSYKVETLTQPLSYYTEFNRFEINSEDVVGVKIERADEVIEITVDESVDKDNYAGRVWKMVSPYNSPANDDYIDDKILSAIAELTLTTPLDADGGFSENSDKLTVKSAMFDNSTGNLGEEHEETLTIGKTESGETYVMHKDKVYKVPSAQLEFVKDKAFNIVSKKQLLVNISGIKSVTIEYGGEKAKMDVSRGSDNKFDFRLDGKDVPREEAQDLYMELADLSADGVYTEGEAGETLMKLTYEASEPQEDTAIEIKKLDDINCVIERNGVSDFTIRKSKIESFGELYKSFLENYR